jgi:hypothetical protein
MTSQRLLTILDPLGHVREHAAPAGTVAVIWAPAPALASSLCTQLAAAEITALVARSFHHVAEVDFMIIDFDAISSTDLSILASIRWNGFRGPIIAIARAGMISPVVMALYQVEAVVARRDLAVPLSALLAKFARPR